MVANMNQILQQEIDRLSSENARMDEQLAAASAAEAAGVAEPQEALQPEEADFWGNGITELTQSPYEIEPDAEQLAAEAAYEPQTDAVYGAETEPVYAPEAEAVYEPQTGARWRRRSSQSEKARWRSASLRRQKKMMFRFIRITSWRRPYPDFRSGIRFRRNSMRWSRRSLSLWTIWTA